jgi:hypothetical protein
MKRLATISSDLIPLALTVIFVIAIVLTLFHVSHDPVAAMGEETSKIEQVCPSATAAQVAQSEKLNEAARSGELESYTASQFP